MSIPINTDNSVQPTLTFTTSSTFENLDTWTKNNTSNIYNTTLGNIGIGTTDNINFKLNVNGSLKASSFYGDGSNISNISYANISGKPSTFPADYNNIINKPSTFPADYNNIINKPSTFPADMTNIYTKTEVNNISSLNNFYNKTSTDTLLNTKQNTLTASTTLLGIGSNLTLINYNTLSNLPNLSQYLTTTNASSTYLTIANASSTYLTTANASSTYLTIANASSTYATITNLNTKQNTLTASTTLLGIGSNLTLVNYNTLSNLPNLSQYLTTANASSTYLTIANASSTYATITNLNAKQDILTASTTVLGIGSNLTLVNYNTLSNLPNLSQYLTTTNASSTYLTIANATSTYATITNLNTKQNTLTASTTLLGIGSNLTLINYNNLNNLPNLSQYALSTSLSTKQDTLTASTTVLGIGSNLTLINYNNLSNLPTLNFLPLTGGTITGNIINTGENASFYFGGGSGAAFGQASGIGAFSSSALVGDCIVRSQGTKQLILQSGSGGGGIIINSANDTTITGQLTLKNNLWHKSADGVLRFYYENNGVTYFHSGNTGSDGFKFRNFAQSDIFTITDAGNVSATGNITTNGIVVSNSGISTFKSIYITNPNNSQTHLPFNNGQNYIRGKVNIDQDDLYVGGTTSLNSTLNVSGITTLNSTLNVSGIATLSSTLSTPQIATSTYNNLLLKSIEIYPFSSIGGAYNNGYWLIDVQDYCSQAGFVYLFLNINSPGFLYWQGRIVIANSSSINFYNDMAYNVNLSLISASSRLKIVVACPSGTNNGFKVMYVKIMG